ncbi:sialate:O-sulfotransferase 1-like [Saccoglossus kowalevskii]|uniref:WSC domain-containing protein 1-like n=1 Tax=Saccoglossus kowalevskii TaxID=10224 RepID=A0ABM0H1B7_SACKO|nr:PREDICTED: WSC domain-containing protein 1-like [Saccoglossus kowalevskii]
MARLRKSDMMYIRRRVVLSVFIVAVSASIWVQMLTASITRQADANSMDTSEPVCNVSLAPPGSRPIVALASYPCSGNTWTRHLLETATGIYTGSVYHDKNLYQGGFLGEMENWQSGTTLIVKRHSHDPTQYLNFHSAIMLIRNPYSVILCERNRQVTNSHTEYSSKEDLVKLDKKSGKDWKDFVKWQIPRWEDAVMSWMESTRPLLAIRYEDMKEDPVREVIKMTDFLNVTIGENGLNCLKQDIEGRFHRSADSEKLQLIEELYTEDLRSAIDSTIDRVTNKLTTHGFQPVSAIA